MAFGLTEQHSVQVGSLEVGEKVNFDHDEVMRTA